MKDNEKFKPEISTHVDFLKKYPQVTFLTLTDLTRELGAIAWVLTTTEDENTINGIFSPYAKSMQKINPAKAKYLSKKEREEISPLPEKASYEDWIYWFYSRNFIPSVLKATYAVDKYIYRTLTNHVKPENFKHLNSRTRGLTKEGEWTLCETFLKTIREQLNFDNLANHYLRHSAVTFVAKSFNSGRSGPTRNFHYFMAEEKGDTLLKNHLFLQRKDEGNHLHLYRATGPFEKKGKRVLDDIMKEDQYVLFSYVTSLFSNLFNDIDACPVSYWYDRDKMQHLKIPTLRDKNP